MFLSGETEFEEWAEDYVMRLKKIYPEGPYCLFGYSLGGQLSFAVAKELIKQGDKISKLILLDSYPNEKWINEAKTKLNIDQVILCKCTEMEDLIKVHKKDFIKHIKSNITDPSMYFDFLKLIIMGTFHTKYRNKILRFLFPKLVGKQLVSKQRYKTKATYNNWDKVLSNNIKVLKYKATHYHTSWMKTTLVSDMAKEILSIKGLKKKK